MSRIRGKDTTPEKVVRLLLHRLGYRFRLHVRIPITAKDAEYAKPVGHKRTQSSQRFPPGGASVLASRSPWRVEVKRRRLNSLARRSDPPRRNVVKTGAKTAPPSTPRFVTPDIVLTKHRVAVFVHGCFWHRHRGCKNCTTPTHRREWWLAKLNGNAARDKLHQRALRKLGWRPIVIWECQTEKPKTLERLRRKLTKLIG